MTQIVVHVELDDFSYEQVKENFIDRFDSAIRKSKPDVAEKELEEVANALVQQLPEKHQLSFAIKVFNATKAERYGYFITPEINNLTTEMMIEEFAKSINAKVEKL